MLKIRIFSRVTFPVLKDYYQSRSAFILTTSPEQNIWNQSCKLTNIVIDKNQGRELVLSIHVIKDHMSNYDEIYSNLHDTGNSVTSSIFLLEGREKEKEY